MMYLVKALPHGEDYETSEADLIVIDRFEASNERAAMKILKKRIQEGHYPADAVVDEEEPCN